jgi:DNA-binding transcriptional MerR regulator
MPEAALLDTPEIPDKLYFRIGEVSRLLGVEPYVLRYWETEFPSVSPKKSDTGHRLYRRKDVEQLLEIKELLYAKRFTIEGARQTLSSNKKVAKEKGPRIEAPHSQQWLFAGASPPEQSVIPEIRKELVAILKMLG